MAVPVDRPKKATRKAGNPWSQPSQARRSLPMLRLLTSLSSIPEVAKIEMLVDGSGTYVHVLISVELRQAAHMIFGAERDYLNSTELHHFDLHVSPASKIPTGGVAGYGLAGYETIFERRCPEAPHAAVD